MDENQNAEIIQTVKECEDTITTILTKCDASKLMDASEMLHKAGYSEFAALLHFAYARHLALQEIKME
jgi:hypothetical protein